MPLYEYRCTPCSKTVTAIRSYPERLDYMTCPQCSAGMEYQFPMTHRQPDGIYSYAPNIGNANDYERRRAALESGQKVIKRTAED